MQHLKRFHGLFAGAIAGMLLLATGPAVAGGLTDLLISKVGVTQPQAVGGAGSIFSLAKSQLTAANFAKLKGAVPGMDGYLGAAPALAPAASALAPAAPAAAGTGMLSGLASKALGSTDQLGGMGSKLATLQQLAPAFEKLGMKPGMVSKFVPVVIDYVQSSGGASTAKLLTGALGF